MLLYLWLSLFQAISTGLVSHAKKQRITPRGDGVAKVKAEPFLTRPALVQGFAEVPPEPKFLGLAGDCFVYFLSHADSCATHALAKLCCTLTLEKNL